MPVCQACYSFVESDRDRCPSCGQARAEIADEKLGLDLLESVEEENRGLRPTLLLFPIAGIPIVFGLWRFALGTDTVTDLLPAILAFALVGGTSIGGLAYMLLRQQRGYDPYESRAWWIAGLGTIVTPLAIAAARFLTPDGNYLSAALLFGGAQGVASMIGAGFLPRIRAAGRRGIPTLGSVLCLGWLAAGALLVLLPLFGR